MPEPISRRGPKLDKRSMVLESGMAKEKRDRNSSRISRASGLRSVFPRQPCSVRNFIASVSLLILSPQADLGL